MKNLLSRSSGTRQRTKRLYAIRGVEARDRKRGPVPNMPLGARSNRRSVPGGTGMGVARSQSARGRNSIGTGTRRAPRPVSPGRSGASVEAGRSSDS